MKRLLYTLLLTIIVLMIGCTDINTQKREPQLNDTIYTANAAMNIYGFNPQRALLILDSAEIVGNLTADEASFLRAKVLCMTLEGERLDSAQIICTKLLQSKYVKNDDKKEEVLDLLIAISRKKDDNEQWLKWTMEKANLCRKKGDEVEALRAEAEVGIILSNLGRTEEGLSKLDEVITRLDGTGSINRWDASIVAMRRKINVLRMKGRYSEVIPIAHQITEKLDHYEKYHDQYANDSYRLRPDSADRARYIDFNRSVVYGYLADAYANESIIDSARYYLTLFEQSNYGHTFGGRRTITTTWIVVGDYAKAFAVYDEMTSYMESDTLNTDYANILWGRAVAADATGDFRAASNYWRRYADLNEILNNQLQQSEANEYAARYRAQEQQMQIEKQKIQNRMQTIIIVIMLIAILLIVFFYNHTVFQKNMLAEKNAALVRLIDQRIHTERLSDAAKMLRENPDMTVTALAKSVGLTPQDLQKLFREQYGMSLTEYRKLHKK